MESGCDMKGGCMAEPVGTSAAVYSFGGALAAGHLLGMPVDSVALGAVASVLVTMISEPKSRWLVVAYTVIGGLLGGAVAPVLGHLLADKLEAGFSSMGTVREQFVRVFAPVMTGLLWQLLLRVLKTVYPHFESRADELVAWLFRLLPFGGKRGK